MKGWAQGNGQRATVVIERARQGAVDCVGVPLLTGPCAPHTFEIGGDLNVFQGNISE